MNRNWIRRITYGAVTIFVAFCMLRIIRVQNDRLQNSSFTSGYILLVAVLFLASFNVRKRLSFVPLGSASAWMQIHIYVGLGAIAIFLAHTGMHWPLGILEIAMFLVFATTSLSGIVGLALTRSVPKRLTKLRRQVIYERIPAERSRVQMAAHQVIVNLVHGSRSAAIADLYLDRLVHYFGLPRSPLYYLAPSSSLRVQLQRELTTLTRFLTNEERAAQQELSLLIDHRDDLDYHHAQQRRLKLWLFGHIGLTVILLGLVVLHVAMAHAFSGRIQ